MGFRRSRVPASGFGACCLSRPPLLRSAPGRATQCHRSRFSNVCEYWTYLPFRDQRPPLSEAISKAPASESDFSELCDVAFEDEDVALLFDPQTDGIEDVEPNGRLDTAHLRLEEWFMPFRPECPVHPYSSA